MSSMTSTKKRRPNPPLWFAIRGGEGSATWGASNPRREPNERVRRTGGGEGSFVMLSDAVVKKKRKTRESKKGESSQRIFAAPVRATSTLSQGVMFASTPLTSISLIPSTTTFTAPKKTFVAPLPLVLWSNP